MYKEECHTFADYRGVRVMVTPLKFLATPLDEWSSLTCCRHRCDAVTPVVMLVVNGNTLSTIINNSWPESSSVIVVVWLEVELAALGRTQGTATANLPKIAYPRFNSSLQ